MTKKKIEPDEIELDDESVNAAPVSEDPEPVSDEVSVGNWRGAVTNPLLRQGEVKELEDSERLQAFVKRGWIEPV